MENKARELLCTSRRSWSSPVSSGAPSRTLGKKNVTSDVNRLQTQSSLTPLTKSPTLCPSRLGVDVCEAGFPIASEGDFDAVKAVAEEVGRRDAKS